MRRGREKKGDMDDEVVLAGRGVSKHTTMLLTFPTVLTADGVVLHHLLLTPLRMDLSGSYFVCSKARVANIYEVITPPT